MSALATVVRYRRTCHAPPPPPHPPRRYSPDQILPLQAATPDPSLTSRLRDLGIGCLPRKPSSSGGRRKQRKIAVVCDGAARLTTQLPNDLLQRPSSARRSVSDLITVVLSGDSRADHASQLSTDHGVFECSVSFSNSR